MKRLGHWLAGGVLAAAATGAAGAAPPVARASCIPTVVVAGQTLNGTAVADLADPSALPEPGDSEPAIVPPCRDGGEPDGRDRPTEVRSLAGVPPRVAVVDPSGRTVYLARGSLTGLAAHPLHAAFQGRGDVPERRCRPRRADLQATVLAVESRGRGFSARAGGRTVFVAVDAGTDVANRPATTPLRRGDRVLVRAAACGVRRADRGRPDHLPAPVARRAPARRRRRGRHRP